MDDDITAMFDNLREQTIASIKLDTETLIKLHKEEEDDNRGKSMGTNTKDVECGR